MEMKTCERCRLTGLDPDELSPNSKGEMWCNICWEQIADLRNRKEKEYPKSNIEPDTFRLRPEELASLEAARRFYL
jgi:hypothetical protein